MVHVSNCPQALSQEIEGKHVIPLSFQLTAGGKACLACSPSLFIICGLPQAQEGFTGIC